ncbi:glycerol-3-phosphate dehydrogenase [Bowmanella dokdonensis]|uniref:Glycerol-3-phosphate dehydrogenase n=1 Tax=Bowmanella dokdonensis TaxID=751969 RepID=A0A939DPI8_9ALTE|nr:glycerol-3-phosphate dehydrogenase [Bowmanella dokdonensis]MBN7826002.1 glycerol-3-phosphate dehydrogenase [Bowmanella dokdonensis]
MTDKVDLLVVGGGINGVGIAADAAGRGLSVLLCEQQDLGWATSSSSSKLIHGGLRYLEQYEFRLVHQALAEREVLLKNAPHIIRPLRFRLPHRAHLRPAWLIRTGLFLYDHLARRVSLPPSARVRMAPGSPLKADIRECFEYSDGWVDDARLVILVARQARNHGASILPHTRCTGAQRHQDYWRVTLQDAGTGRVRQVQTRVLANAAGPWVGRFFKDDLKLQSQNRIRLVKGSHILVPRIKDDGYAYILQHRDGRIVFVIPYEQAYSLIGTTEVEFDGEPGKVSISDPEIRYLLDTVNDYFCAQLAPSDLVHSYSGIRPLLEDNRLEARQVSRDYRVELSHGDDQAALLTVFGGKITTYRRLAQAAVNHLVGLFPGMGRPWTADSLLPGGDFSDLPILICQLQQDYPWLPGDLVARLARQYGTLTQGVLQDCRSVPDLGRHFGHGLYQREVDYLCEQEWARSTEDILWRRTKLGLQFDQAQTLALQDYLAGTGDAS